MYTVSQYDLHCHLAITKVVIKFLQSIAVTEMVLVLDELILLQISYAVCLPKIIKSVDIRIS